MKALSGFEVQLGSHGIWFQAEVATSHLSRSRMVTVLGKQVGTLSDCAPYPGPHPGP